MINLNDEFIKKNCSPTIYKRGEEYFRQGRAHLKKRPDDVISAAVDDDVLYNVQIKLGERGIDFMFCSCAYFETMGTPCKHIAAALMQKLASKEQEPSNDENDTLCERVWNAYMSADDEPKRLPIHFDISINYNSSVNYVYTVAIRINGKEIQNPIEFFSARSKGEKFELSARQKNVPTHSFSAYEEQILDVFTEVYENNLATNEIYTISSHMYFGASAARRIFSVLGNTDYSVTLNHAYLGRLHIIEGDPDIVIDISAEGTEIQLYTADSGAALTPDGSVFLYEDTVYLTTDDWRRKYIPVYRALASDNRTQLTFRGDNALGFATYVLPHIAQLPGTITDNLNNAVINGVPEFTSYLDCRAGIITCAIKVTYGGISFMLPDGNLVSGDKIIIRDTEREEEVMSCLESFTFADGLYRLSGDTEIFTFLTTELDRLNRLSTVLTTDTFTRGGIRRSFEMSGRISYTEKIDLLEADIETELSVAELRGILSAIKEKKRFYRLTDGGFIDIEQDKRIFMPLINLGMTENTDKLHFALEKFQLLYLSTLDDERFEMNEPVKQLIDKLKNIRANIPENLDGVLRDYQKDGLNWMKQLTYLGLGGILADDMGLGKTLQMLAFIHNENPDKPSLIITPSSLTYNWLAELERFIPDASVLIADGTKEERSAVLADMGKYEFIITSYPLLRRDIGIYEKADFAYCVIDEAQNIKNPKTVNAHCVKRIKADYRFALTGTPIENSLSELWSIFDFVQSGYLKTLTDFHEWYELPIMHGDTAALDELRNKIRPFVMRRLKKQVLDELPEKIENTIFAEMTQEQSKVYAAFRQIAKDRAQILLADGTSGSRMQILTLILRLRQICCHPRLFDEAYKKESGKLNLLRDMIETGLASGHRILVFSQFTSMLEIIKGYLDNAGIGYFYLDGKTKAAERTQSVAQFNSGEREVFLISLKAGGTGLNLTGADMVIHYDPWWNPAVTDQASDRAYRIGQTKAVQIIRLASRNTIEEKILKLQEQKRALADELVTTNTMSFANMSAEEIISLFE